ncbi:MAG: hypothetical protein AABW66_06890, partial [Thermoproteota archaeon]
VNTKIFVFVAIIALAAAMGIILLSGSSFVSPTSEKDTTQEISQAPQKIQPISVELDDISITEVNKRDATIEISFKVSNPNPGSVIVQVMDYQLFETGFSNEKQISGGQIGSRPEGMVEFESNYYTLLGEHSILLKDKLVLKNTGNTPELWSAFESNTAKWRVSGDIFFNQSSMTQGQENELHFEFVK